MNLFGVGIYLSALPGVSLMYGPALLLCKVLPGRAETFRPDGTLPPDIPAEYDSRFGLNSVLNVKGLSTRRRS